MCLFGGMLQQQMGIRDVAGDVLCDLVWCSYVCCGRLFLSVIQDQAKDKAQEAGFEALGAAR